ncbi:MAG: hypothetical protein AAGH79_15700, partial [Bacteroidota bacterium]
LGFTMAVWFNNWNADRRALEQQRQSLIEVQTALQRDLADVEINILGFGNRVEVLESFLAGLAQTPPSIPGSTLKYMGILHGWTSFISNKGAYETLKLRGMETISNDSLRQAISYYYEIRQQHILSTEKVYQDHFFDHFKPQLMRHFTSKDMSLAPVDLVQTKKDRYFKEVAGFAFSYEQMMLGIYENMVTEIETLAEQINQELERL